MDQVHESAQILDRRVEPQDAAAVFVRQTYVSLPELIHDVVCARNLVSNNLWDGHLARFTQTIRFRTDENQAALKDSVSSGWTYTPVDGALSPFARTPRPTRKPVLAVTLSLPIAKSPRVMQLSNCAFTGWWGQKW
jgi:hypothetical protein